MAKLWKKERINHLIGHERQIIWRKKKLKILLQEKLQSLVPAVEAEVEVVGRQELAQLQSCHPFKCQLKQSEPILVPNKLRHKSLSVP